jgi:hypothetical protein
MKRRFSAVAFAAVALAAIASGSAPARADDRADGEFTRRLFGSPTGAQKSYACFARRYDSDHLARRRLQKVSAMKLLVTAERDAESNTPMYSFRLGLKYRDRQGDFGSSGECGRGEGADTGQFGCGVDCDGGGIEVEIAKDNKSILVKVERIRIWRNNRPDDEASSQSLVGGADDRVFRLNRASLEDCKSLVTDRQELAALRHK